MADATRYRTLKDQIKKLEGSQARIQELLEGILKSQQQWEAKWEANEKKVEERVTGLESQMKALMKRTSGHEKVVIPDETPRVVDKTPLLPTPSQKLGEDADWSFWPE